MNKAYKTAVTFPRSGLTYHFKSERAVARMLSGNGTASGGLRKQIAIAVDYNRKVRNNQLSAVVPMLNGEGVVFNISIAA
jgi:hypothetical protein